MISRNHRYVVYFVLSWVFAIFFRKLALDTGAHPVTFLVQSGLISVMLLTSYILIARREEVRKIFHNSRYKYVAGMGIAVGLAWIFDTWGLKLTSSINYSFLLKSGFIFSIAFGTIFFKEPLSRLKIVSSSAFLFGAYLITTSGKSIVPESGDLLVIGAALFYSTSSVFQKKLTRHMNAEIIGWLRTTSAVIITVIFLIIINPEEVHGAIVAPWYILVTGILLSFTTIYLNKSLAVVSLSYLSMMTMAVPVLNGILGYIFLQERLSALQIVGGGIIILSVYFVNKLQIK